MEACEKQETVSFRINADKRKIVKIALFVCLKTVLEGKQFCLYNVSIAKLFTAKTLELRKLDSQMKVKDACNLVEILTHKMIHLANIRVCTNNMVLDSNVRSCSKTVKFQTFENENEGQGNQ